MNADQRMVAGVDGSDFSTTALRLAGRMASSPVDCPVLVVGDGPGRQQPGG
ncbi:hypothetical protein AB4Y67_11915 [Arthrobacter sp. YAF17]|uniref:hypothetical protein n=1 Tax=Arthrobacter sp. YAF17 TaxID=3233077 RepID=UPI003F8FA1B1